MDSVSVFFHSRHFFSTAICTNQLHWPLVTHHVFSHRWGERSRVNRSSIWLQAPAQSMQPTRRNPRVPSPGPLRPFTPPDLSSIPHMDDTPLHNGSNGNGSNASIAVNRTNDDAQQEPTGPFIIGSPINLGDIDNVDNIGFRLDPITRGSSRRGRTREHIELQETGSPDSDGE